MIVFGVLSIVIHSVFLYSVVDIYFKSPIIHGMTPFATPAPAPAKRVVLFVVDGLRADKFFQVDDLGVSKMPYMRNIITDVGAWGVSHTRVPTESRPGHVAITAGIFEDVSSITKGWKENPVEFDSVFNESRYTFAWGSPDILPMFSKGSRKNVFIHTYGPEVEDFASANPYHLDEWVFDEFENFLMTAKSNSTVAEMLHQDKVIIFLHLLGMDVIGHSYKPYSEEYVKNMQVVDTRIQNCVNVIENYFSSDEKTAFIFTSDHGMTDWGSHGSGDVEETRTPLVAWGSGIRRPLGEGKDIYHDGLSDEWKLSQVKRVDVNQVDIAPFLAALVGIPFPVNSLGILPVEYLGTDWTFKAVALLTNARQVVANYQRQMLEKRESTLPLFFWQFKELSKYRQAELMTMVDTLLRQNRYKDAIQVGLKIIELALKGITYYQRHDRIALGFSIFLGFLGWISYVTVLVLRDYTSIGFTSLESSIPSLPETFPKSKCVIVFGMTAIFVTFLLHVQQSPIMYYAYFLLPVVLWMLVSLQWDLIVSAKLHLERRKVFLKCIGLFFLYLIGLELLVFSFFKREMLSFNLWAISMWPFISPVTRSHKHMCFSWCATSLILSVFPMMSVVGRDTNYPLVILAGWLFILVVAACARRPETGLILNNRQMKREPHRVVVLTAIQVIILCISTYNIQSTSSSIANKTGLPILNQMLSWIILGVSLIFPLFGSKTLLTRLLNIMTSFFAPYLLLCTSHEGIFFLFLCIQMVLWLALEHQLSCNYIRLQDVCFASNLKSPSKKLNNAVNVDDLRRAYFFIFFILLAFFGTGNIASINSFDPTSVYCFLTIFNPFVMGFLLLIKVILPFLIVSCVLRAINVSLDASPRALFLIILAMSDFMSLHFFFMVRDTGSWLDIGTSLSHFIISMTIIMFIMLLYGMASIITSVTLKVPSLLVKRHLL